MGLPAEDPRREHNRNRDAQRNGEGGVVGFLQSIIDALDPEDERPEGQRPGIEIVQDDGPPPEGAQDGDVVLDVELVIEDAGENEGGEENGAGENQGEQDGQNEFPGELEPAEPAGGEGHFPEQREHQLQGDAQAEEDHEAPVAPPARASLGTVLSSVSNSILSALMLPAVSFAMGEALRVALPGTRQQGLLKQQWGRSLVGGGLYIVMKDVVRLYAKHRKVQALANRRVKNVDRPRRRNQG